MCVNTHSSLFVCLFVCCCCFNQFRDIAPKRRLAEDQIEKDLTPKIPRKNSLKSKNGLETKISRTFWDFYHLGHEFCVTSGHGA